jgi:hypothetical protein
MAGRGNPKFKPEYVEQAKKLSKLGATLFDMGQFFGVSDRAIKDWLAEKPAFAAAVKLGRAPADQRVKRALYERAVGYSFGTEKVFCVEGVIVRAPFVEHVPPDVSAARLWLMNRLPDEFRAKAEQESGGNITVEVVNFAGALEKPKVIIDN